MHNQPYVPVSSFSRCFPPLVLLANRTTLQLESQIMKLGGLMPDVTSEPSH